MTTHCEALTGGQFRHGSAGISAIVNQVDIKTTYVYAFWAGIEVIHTPVAGAIINLAYSSTRGLLRCEDIEISENNITETGTGIYVDKAIGRFTSNLFDRNDTGIFITHDHPMSAYFSTLDILGNWFTDNEIGIELPHENNRYAGKAGLRL